MRDTARAALRLRTISALLMAVVALAAIAAGPAAFAVLVGGAALVLAWEWSGLVGQRPFDALGIAQCVAAVAIVATAALGTPGGAIVLAGAASGAIWLLAGRLGRAHAPWLAAGPLYIGLPCIALVWLRGAGPQGESMILWLLATVWATDTGAYFAGRLIGGPRLAPRISPNKTWAGLFGAIASAAAVALLFGIFDPAVPPVAVLVLAGAILAVVAQGGDLGESFVKRRFGAKDSSHLIPGHGGLFDRVDGLLAAAPALALWQWLTQGEVLSWG